MILGRGDHNEVEATKNAKRLNLPVFVVTYPSPSAQTRNVHLAAIEHWDDEAETFLVTFLDEWPSVESEQQQLFSDLLISPDKSQDEEFRLTSQDYNHVSYTSTPTRPGQAHFGFKVRKRYGSQCAVWDVDIPELLDAAHLRPKEKNGSDDPRNGLVLCANHHRAFDEHFFSIEPDSLQIQYLDALNPDRLNLRHTDIAHLPKKPHPKALQWRWQQAQSEVE